MTKVGMLSIGQTPRNDLLPLLRDAMGAGYEFVEAGALDGLSKKQVDALGSKPGDYMLATRLNDGSEVIVAKRVLLPLLQKKLTELEDKGVRLTVVMCTGKFPQFESKGILVTPTEVLHGVLGSALKKGKLGILYPVRSQIDSMHEEFGREGITLYGDYYSPFEGHDLDDVCKRLKAQKLDLILLNCFGYPRKVKERVQEITGVPAIHSSVVVAKVMTELA